MEPIEDPPSCEASCGRAAFLCFVAASLLSLLTACSPDDSRRRLVTQVEASDSAGVSRVRITNLFELRVPEVSAEQVWRSELADLHSVRDAWIEADGSVLLANSGNSEVVRLDPGGEPVTRFGSVGEGPGEFARFGLDWIDASEEGRIVVHDERRARITVFDPGGTVLASHQVVPPSQRASLRPVSLASRGRILATHGEVRRFDREGLVRDTVPLLSISFASADELPPGERGRTVDAVDTLGLWPGPERLIADTPSGRARVPVGFADTFLHDGAGSVAAVSTSETVDVQIFEGEQRTATVEATASRRPVSPDDSDRWRRDLAERLPDPVVDEVWRGEAMVKQVYPTLDRLVVAQDGSVWLGVHPTYGERSRAFILLDPRGIPVGRLRIPEASEVLAASSGHFVTVARNELDEERIELWNLQ